MDIHTCIRLKKCIQTDGPTTRRVHGRTIGRTDERKENIRTDRVTFDLLLKYEYRQTNGRTQTIYELVDRQTETYTKLYNYIRTNGQIDDQI